MKYLSTLQFIQVIIIFWIFNELQLGVNDKVVWTIRCKTHMSMYPLLMKCRN